MLGRFPLSAAALGSLETAISETAAEQVFYFSSGGLTTGPEEAPANWHFDPCVSRPPDLERSIVESGRFLGGNLLRTIGTIEFANAEGDMDALVANFGVDGRRVCVKVGGVDTNQAGLRTAWSYGDFQVLFEGTALGWEYGTDTLSLRVRGNDYLMRLPIQTDRYLGLGDYSGDEDLEDRQRPQTYGRCFNVPALLINESELIYQVHDRQTAAIDAVYDMGNGLTPGNDYPNYETLAAVTTAGGNFDTCLALGLFKLGSPPAGQVTADVRGDAQGGYVNTSAAIIKRIAIDRAGLASGLVNEGAFASLDVLQPAEVGIFVDRDGATASDVIGELARGIGAFWGFGRDGRLRVGRFDGPGSAVSGRFDGADMIDIRRRRLPYEIQPHLFTVGYARNWTVQTGQLAGGVSQSRQRFLAETYRYSAAENTDIIGRHPTSTAPPAIEALFVERSDAKAEAKRMLELYGPERSMYVVVLKLSSVLLEIGSTIVITYHRWGLSAGKSFSVVGIRENAAENEAEVTIFG